MSERSNRERKAFFDKISQECSQSINKTIEDCSNISKALGLGPLDIPHIATYYHNKMISLEKDFLAADINFFDDTECACYTIIARSFDMLLAKSAVSLNNYAKILNISKEQVQEYIDSFKKPGFFDMIFKGAKYSPKKCILTDKQIYDSRLCIKEYVSCCDQIYSFSIADDIAEVFKQYYAYSVINGIKISDEFVSKIDTEIQKLGYASIRSTLNYEIQMLDMSFDVFSYIQNSIAN